MDGSGYMDLPVWDGNPENLPLWQKFLYNGKEYLTIIHDGSRRVLDVTTGHPNTAMTLRVSGTNTSIGIANVLIKSGIATNEELAKAVETHGGIPDSMLKKFIRLVTKQRSPVQWLKSKG